MPFKADQFPFTARLIAGAPDAPGVYALWAGGEPIYIGHAAGRGATIRSCLVEHFSGGPGPCTRRATHYSWQLCADPAAREAELLAEYLAAHRRPPRCNAA